jgi:PAS domain S-box-containing protein
MLGTKHKRSERRAKLFGLLAVTGVPLLLLLVGGTLYFEFQRAEESEANVHRSFETRSQIQRVFSLLQDSETGQRGYVISGNSQYAAPYDAAKGSFNNEIELLSTLIDASREQRVDLENLRWLGTALLEAHGSIIASRDGKGTAAAMELVASGIGKTIMDQVRLVVERMSGREVRALDASIATAHARTLRTQILVASVFLGLIALLLASAFLVWRYSRAREELLVQIRTTGARQEAILDSSIDGIITLNPSGTIETVNKAAERLFDFSADELDRRDISKLIEIGGNGERPFLDRLGASHGALTSGIVRELTARRRDGSTFSVDVAFGAMHLPTGTHVVAAIRDVTERRRIEDLKNEFIATVSHELRTPLTSIVGSLTLLTTGAVEEMPRESLRLLQIANNNGQRLVRLVNDILDVEKIESGKFSLDFQKIDFGDIAQKSIDEMDGLANELGVRILLMADDQIAVRADADRLVQVTTNLLSNACKYSPRGATVTVTVQRIATSARLSIADRGPGVPQEFRSSIFSKFAQAQDDRSKSGTGLGLIIAKEIAELHGGQLWFESELGEGAVFHVDIPLWDASTVTTSRLLLCEDDAKESGLLANLLIQGGFAVDVARTVQDGVEMAQSGHYSAALIDLMPPGGNNVDLIRSLRACPATRNLPLVLLGAKPDGDVMEGHSIVVVDWLDKPFDEARLQAAVAAGLAGTNALAPIVLHVEDDPDIAEITRSALAGIARVVSAPNLSAARAQLVKQRPDLVILDLGLSDGSGPDLLPELTDAAGRTVPVVIYTAQELASDLADRVDSVLIKSRSSLGILTQVVRRLILEREDSRHAA